MFDPFDTTQPDYCEFAGYIPCRSEYCDEDELHPIHPIKPRPGRPPKGVTRIARPLTTQKQRLDKLHDSEKPDSTCPTCRGKGWLLNPCVGCQTCHGHGKLSLGLRTLLAREAK